MKSEINMNIDYLIVGCGLAGIAFAETCLQNNKSILVYDNNSQTSSTIAAGLYNPVVFKRLVKSWLADDLLPYMDEFYPEMEKLLGTKFYFSKRILKPAAIFEAVFGFASSITITDLPLFRSVSASMLPAKPCPTII